MNATARFFLSISAFALAAITVASAFSLGLAAPLTVSSFSFLAIYGIIEIALVSAVPTPSVRLPRTVPAPIVTLPVPASMRHARVSAVVEYAPVSASRRAA